MGTSNTNTTTTKPNTYSTAKKGAVADLVASENEIAEKELGELVELWGELDETTRKQILEVARTRAAQKPGFRGVE